MSGMGAATSFEVIGKPKPPVGNEPVADIRIIAGDYFRALQIPLRAGRFFGPQDGPSSRVIIVDETLARESWPGQDPVGRQLRVTWNDENAHTVIGVVGDIHPERLDHAGRATIYWPLTYDARSTMGMVVRTSTDEAALVPAIERLVGRIEPDATVSNVRTMDGMVTRSVASRRLPMMLLVLFAATALVLAAVGLFALVSYTVTSRRRELGIRMAVGAAAVDVRRWVLGYALRVALPGATAGVLASWLFARYLRELLFDISPTDIPTFASAGLLLTAVVVLAAWLPARRAGRVDPAEILRAD
jgi:predicted permease